MYQIVEKRGLWFTVSIILTIPGIIFMIYMLATTGSPLPLSIDFTGGTLWEMRFDQPVTPGEVRQTFAQAGYQDTVAYSVGGDATDIQVKLKNLDTPAKEALVQQVEANLGTFEELSYRSIGPAIGSEVSRAALLAAALGALLWLLHQVPKRRSLLGWVALAGGLLVVLVMLLSWRPASVQIRSELWQAAWAGVHTTTPLPRWDGGSDGLAGARPWIGYGQDNLEPALTLVRAPVLNSLQARGFDTLADRSHNALLDRWLSNGLLGALPGLLLWGLLARSVWRKLDGPGSALAAAWFAAWADRAFGVPSPGADLLLALLTSGCLWVVRSDTPSPVRTRPFILLALLPLLGLLAPLLSGLHHWVWHAPRSPALPTASHWPCGNDAPRAAQRIALSQQPYSVLPWLRLDEAALAACASVPGLAEHLTAAAPSLPRAWLWRARLEMAAGDSVSAQQSLLQAQRLLPAHDAAARLSAYAQAGAVKADDPTSALAALDALWALGPAPEDLAWWRTLGYLQAVAGQRQAAIEAYRLALQQNPADGASRRNLARLQASSQE